MVGKILLALAATIPYPGYTIDKHHKCVELMKKIHDSVTSTGAEVAYFYKDTEVHVITYKHECRGFEEWMVMNPYAKPRKEYQGYTRVAECYHSGFKRYVMVRAVMKPTDENCQNKKNGWGTDPSPIHRDGPSGKDF